MSSETGGQQVDTGNAAAADTEHCRDVRNAFLAIAAFLAASLLTSLAFTALGSSENAKPKQSGFKNMSEDTKRIADNLTGQASALESEAEQAMSPEVAATKRKQALGLRLFSVFVLLLPTGFLYFLFRRSRK